MILLILLAIIVFLSVRLNRVANNLKTTEQKLEATEQKLEACESKPGLKFTSLDELQDAISDIGDADEYGLYGKSANWDVSGIKELGMAFKYLKTSRGGTTNATESNYDGPFKKQLDVSNWKTNGVSSMRGLFMRGGFVEFNQDISGWDVSTVEDMSLMFAEAENFNRKLGWELSSGTNVEGMFVGAKYGEDLSSYEVTIKE